MPQIRLRRRSREAVDGYQPASYPGPSGLGGNYPAPPDCRRRTSGADCYPVLRGRSVLEASARLVGRGDLETRSGRGPVS